MNKPTIEYLYHFTCEQCKLWWSIALEGELKKRKWYCPWCGHEQETKERFYIHP